MALFIDFSHRWPLTAAIVTTPFLLLFVFMTQGSSWYDVLRIESERWEVVHFYASLFSGFVAFLAAYNLRALAWGRVVAADQAQSGARIRVRFRLAAVGFAAVGLMFLLSGLTMPGELGLGRPSDRVELFVWLFHLGLPLGAVYWGLASIRPLPGSKALWWKLPRLTAVAGLLLVGGLLLAVTAVPQFFQALSANPLALWLRAMLSVVTVGLYLWAALRTWSDLQIHGTLFGQRLALALLLLAEAQACLALGNAGSLVWFLYYPLTLAAMLVAVWSILSTLRINNEIQIARYFAVTGSILIVGLSVTLGELVISLHSLQHLRLIIMPVLLLQGLGSFLFLYAIVAYLDRLIGRRTADYRREQRLRTDLTQMIVHDLKSPITVIRSSIGILLKGYLGGLTPRQEQVLRRAEESNQHILQMIDNLLDVERLEAGVLNLKQHDIDTVNWLRRSLNDWELVAGARKMTLRVTIPETLPRLRGDRDLLRRVLDNLLTNALSFSSPEGMVEVTAVAQAGDVVIRVTDYGPGVPEMERERIFEKFAQVDGGQRRGSGLGLTFCKMVVDAHEGKITVEENQAGGAVFVVRLPAAFATEVVGAAPGSEDNTAVTHLPAVSKPFQADRAP